MGSALFPNPAEMTMTQVQTTQSSQAAPANALEPITLDYPITKPDGTKVDSVTLRRATVRDLRRMKDFGSDPADQELGLIARLAGLVPEDLDLIDAADYAKLQRSFRPLVGAPA